LFRWAVDRSIPENHLSWAYTLDDGFDGINAGWNSLGQFQKDFDEFFEPFSVYEHLLPQIATQKS